MTTINRRFIALAFGIFSALGCADDASPAADPDMELAQGEEEPNLDSLESALVDEPDDRSDYVSELNLHDGWYGEWYTQWCAAGTYATHYKQRVESSQGGGDDTALNAITLYCKKPSGSGGNSIEPHPGLYGTYSSYASCGSNSNGTPRLMIGGSIKVERKQGGDHWYKPFASSTDDTAANDVHMKCAGSGSAEADREGKWGDWFPVKTCPTGSAVCGLSVRVESSRGSRDDTSLNGVHLKCCKI